ncbi:MAG: transcriptional regulator NrdR [Caldilineaceae bacterium]|nr:transcriptional regulator NrdR [Caldilineaceae bacterium]
MVCPHCGHGSHKVIDTRDTGEAIRRRRECQQCGQRFTSYEHVAPSLLVIKRDGRREPFDRQKLLVGLRIATAKRAISSEIVEEIARYVEESVSGMGKAEINSEIIGNLVLDRLAQVDQVAYIRFASVYLELNDAIEVRSELDRLIGRQTGSI